MALTLKNSPGHCSDTARRLFMILSPHSLPYASLALRSLFKNTVEPIHLSLITDSLADKQRLTAEFSIFEDVGIGAHGWTVFGASDLDDREAVQFARYEHLRTLRRGHPCWRKITDPLLLSADGKEMILLDPDLHFPNWFRFEETPETGLLLMWQKPCCLLPPEVVQAAINANVRLAHHVDIGVAHWRQPVDLEWLNWLIGILGGRDLPRNMHVEAIVWAALAMRIGGGYLDPRFWVCWHRTQYKRVLRKLGISGTYILGREDFSGIKCFHAGGEAKWWLPDAFELGMLNQNTEAVAASSVKPFVELQPSQYAGLQRNRRWLRRLGYYSVLGQ
jgi:hypothetical protein